MLFLLIFIVTYIIIVISINLYYKSLFIKDYEENIQKYNNFCYDTTLDGFYSWWDDQTYGFTSKPFIDPLSTLIPIVNIIIILKAIIFFIIKQLGKIKII